MKIIFLGTNGWYSTNMGNTICTLIESSKFYLILDAGDGFYKLGKYIEKDLPIYLFLSHIHLDHIIGLHILNKFNFNQGINIFCFSGERKFLFDLLNHPYTASIEEIKTNIEIHEKSEGKFNYPLNYESKLLYHSDPCLGYRFQIEDKSIVYCTDTGLCENMRKLSRNADVLISECGYKIETEYSEWPHLNPKEAAQIARDENVKNLILTHFSADLYAEMQDRKEAEKIAKKIFENSTVAYDDQIIDI